jgi:hypothetical protein
VINQVRIDCIDLGGPAAIGVSQVFEELFDLLRLRLVLVHEVGDSGRVVTRLKIACLEPFLLSSGPNEFLARIWNLQRSIVVLRWLVKLAMFLCIQGDVENNIWHVIPKFQE